MNLPTVTGGTSLVGRGLERLRGLAQRPDQPRLHAEPTLDDLSWAFRTQVGDRIYFDFYSDSIRTDAEPRLKAWVQWLQHNSHVRVRLMGNANKRETPENGQEIGLLRALSTCAYLIHHGIEADRITAGSFGTIADGSNEETWARNRNVEMELVGTGGESPSALFSIYFDWDRSTLTSEARSVVGVIKERFANATPPTHLVIVGHADTSAPWDLIGSLDGRGYNHDLSLRRAEAVAEELAALGFDRSIMVVRAKGQDQPVVLAGEGNREPRNRRITVEVFHSTRSGLGPMKSTAAPL